MVSAAERRVERQFTRASSQISTARRNVATQTRRALAAQQSLQERQSALTSQEGLRRITTSQGLVQQQQTLSSISAQQLQVQSFQQQLERVGSEIDTAAESLTRQRRDALQTLQLPQRAVFDIGGGQTAEFTAGSDIGTIRQDGVAVGTTTRGGLGARGTFAGGQTVPFSTPFGEGVDVPGFRAVGTTPSGGVIAQEIRTPTPTAQAAGGQTPIPRRDLIRAELRRRFPSLSELQIGERVRRFEEAAQRFRPGAAPEEAVGIRPEEVIPAIGAGFIGAAERGVVQPFQVVSQFPGIEVIPQRGAETIPGVQFFQTAQLPTAQAQEIVGTVGAFGIFGTAFETGATASALQRQLAQEVLRPRVSFSGLVFGEQAEIVAATTIRGIPIRSFIQGTFVRNPSGQIVGFQSTDIGLIRLNQRDVEVILRDIISQRRALGQARIVADPAPTTFPLGDPARAQQIRAAEFELAQAQTSFSRALAQPFARGVVRDVSLIDEPAVLESQLFQEPFGLGAGSVLERQRLAGLVTETTFPPGTPQITRSKIVGIAGRVETQTPEQFGIPGLAEGLRIKNVQNEVIGFIGGSPRLRVAKSGELTFVFDPRIRGTVTVLRPGETAGTSLGDAASLIAQGRGTQITTQQFALNFPGAAIDVGIRQAALQRFVPALGRLQAQIQAGEVGVRQSATILGTRIAQPAFGAPVTQQQQAQQQQQQFGLVRQFEGINIPQATQQEIQTRQVGVPGIGLGGLALGQPRTGQIRITAPGQVEIVVPSLTQTQRSGLRSRLLTRFRTEQLQVPAEAEAQRFIEIPGQRIITTEIPGQQQRQIQVQVPRVPQLLQPQIPQVPGAAVTLQTPERSFSETREKLEKIKGGVNVVVGKGDRKKVVFRNLPPNLALRRGLEHIKRTIRGSFVLKASGKKAKRRDVSFRTPSRAEFRPGKTNALRIVERQTLRLNTAKELTQLAESRRVADRRRKRRGIFSL